MSPQAGQGGVREEMDYSCGYPVVTVLYMVTKLRQFSILPTMLTWPSPWQRRQHRTSLMSSLHKLGQENLL